VGLSAENLGCERGERLVFSGLGFRVEPGGALLLQGPNGSGKSSLLRVLAGFTPPAAGRLMWDGQPVAGNPEAHRARTHYVGHLDAVKAAFTAAEHLEFWRRLGGGGESGAVAAALSRMGLGPQAHMAARLLSAGQRRRLNLARLLLRKAALWLLDEPATSLDAESIATIGRMIADHRAEGGMAVIASHGDFPAPGAARLDLGPAP
jgi:heme exporter protein A